MEIVTWNSVKMVWIGVGLDDEIDGDDVDVDDNGNDIGDNKLTMTIGIGTVMTLKNTNSVGTVINSDDHVETSVV